MIFLTVGTSFPFDRLVKAIDELAGQGKIDSEIYAQVGIGGYTPRHFESVETLDKNTFDEFFTKSDAVIAHAGMDVPGKVELIAFKILRSRDLFDLGTDPTRYIVYPGGNSFYIHEVVRDALAERGCEPNDSDLDGTGLISIRFFLPEHFTAIALTYQLAALLPCASFRI